MTWTNKLTPHRKKILRSEALKKHGMRDQRPSAFLEGMDSYAEEYKKVKKAALREHPSLLRIFECDDVTFYKRSTDELLSMNSMGEYKRVHFKTLDIEDVVDESTRGENGLVNEHHEKQEGTIITGYTTCIEGNGTRRTIVAMRNSTGTEGSYDIRCAMKMAALLHELGHVDDIEKGINWRRDNKIQWVDSEVYAHHYACKKMIDSNYFLVLGHFIDGLRKMMIDGYKHARLGAARFFESPETTHYLQELKRIQDLRS